MGFGIENVLNIITAIGVLAVVTVGLYIILGLMQVINMAHGDMVMLGAYSVVTFTKMGINYWLAALFSAFFVALVGAIVELCVVQFLYKTGNLSTMLATWGIGIVLQQTIKLIFGPQGEFVDVPVTSMINIMGIEYPAYRLILFLLCVVILVGIFFILKKTKAGLLVRTTMDNRIMAQAMGINTKNVYLFGFISGSALAGLAGALIAPITNISPLMGLDYVTKSFLVVISGGVDSMLSTIGGSFIIAGFQTFFNGFMGATNSWMTVLVIVIIALWVRPRGVFSKK